MNPDQCYCVNPVLVLSMNMCGNCYCRIDSGQPRGKDLWEGYVRRNGEWVCGLTRSAYVNECVDCHCKMKIIKLDDDGILWQCECGYTYED